MIATLLLSLCLSQTGNPAAASHENPFALNEAIKEFLDKNIDKSADSLQQLRTLVQLVFRQNALHFTYQPVTRTAIETFDNHGGNCVSYTFLLIAMARHLGLNARFREVDIVPIWSEVGSITSVDGHADVEVRIGPQAYIVDLFPTVYAIQLGGRTVPDERAVAHFWNNRGAEQLVANNPREAIACFRYALEIDPTAAFVWVNMGVAETVNEDYEEATLCYQKALHLDKKESIAMSNLASLYQHMGRLQDAHRYEEEVKRFNDKNPYYHFNLGLQAYQSGRYRESIGELRSALKLKSTDHHFYLAMAKDYARLGDLEKARQTIKLALKNAPDDDWKVRYTQKLDWLAAQLSEP